MLQSIHPTPPTPASVRLHDDDRLILNLIIGYVIVGITVVVAELGIIIGILMHSGVK